MRRLKCHRCGSAELVLYEVYQEHGQYDGGLFVNDGGRIQARGSAVLSQGDVQPRLTRIECESCGHNWHPRRAFAGGEADGAEFPAESKATCAEAERMARTERADYTD